MKLNIQYFAGEHGKIVIGTVVDETGFNKGIKDMENTEVSVNVQPQIETDNTGETIEKLFAKEKKPEVEIDLDISTKSTEELIQMEREFTKEYEHYANLVEPFEKQQEEIIAKRAQAIQVDRRVHKIRINMTDEEIEQYHQLEKASEEYANKMNEAIQKSVEVNKVLADRGVILHRNIEAEKTGEKWYNPMGKLKDGREYWEKSYLDREADAKSPLNDLTEEELAIKGFSESLNQLIAQYDKIQKKNIISDQDLADAEKLKEEIIYLKEELEKMTGSHITIKGITDIKNDLPGINENIKNIGKGIQGITKKVAKWALAIFGVRTAYNAIRSAMSTLTQYDNGLKADVEYLTFALANSLKPVIEWIIKAVYKLLGLIGGFIKIATGYNIFKNSGIDDYEKSLKKANKSAKDLRKTLAGFDEMNILQDNTKGAGTGSSGTPNFGDLSDQVDKQAKVIEKKIQGIVDKWFKAGDDLKKALDDPEMFTKVYGHWDKFFEGIVQVTYGAWEIITGIFETVGGLMDMLVGVFTGDWEKIKSGFKFFVDGLLTILSGVLDMAVGLLKMAFGLIKGILGDLWTGIKQIVKAGWEWIKSTSQAGWGFIKGIFVGVANWFNKNVITPVKNFFSGLWTGIKNTASGAWTGIKNVFSAVGTWFRDNVTTPLKEAFDTAIEYIKGLFTGLWNKVQEIVEKIKGALSGIGDKIGKAKDKVGNFFSNVGNGVKNFFGFKKGGVVYYKKGGIVPLASGAIINQPGRGVPIGGEHGAEGIIPLTDSQQMMLLGEAIGKYISITANITNTMNGRVISKELQKITAENDFAYNR